MNLTIKEKIAVLYWKLCYNFMSTTDLKSILLYIDDIKNSVWYVDTTPRNTVILTKLINKIIIKRKAKQ